MTTANITDAEAGCPSHLEPAFDAAIIDPSPFVRHERDNIAKLELSVHGAHCGGCIAKIEGGLKSISGVESARLNLSTGRLAVAWREGALHPIVLTQKIASLGYRAAAFDPAAAVAEVDREGRFLLRCMAVAGFAMANIMLLSVAIWAGHGGPGGGEMGPATRQFMHWISGMIALPAVAFAGRPFFRSALSVS